MYADGIPAQLASLLKILPTAPGYSGPIINVDDLVAYILSTTLSSPEVPASAQAVPSLDHKRKREEMEENGTGKYFILYVK